MSAQARLTIDSLVGCLEKAEREIANEFALDAATNTFTEPLPPWVARISELVHAAKDHALNARDLIT